MVSGAISSSQLVLSGFLPVICFSGDGVAAGSKPAKETTSCATQKWIWSPDETSFLPHCPHRVHVELIWFGSEVVLLLSSRFGAGRYHTGSLRRLFFLSLASPLLSPHLSSLHPPRPSSRLIAYCHFTPRSLAVLVPHPPLLSHQLLVWPQQSDHQRKKKPNPLSSQGFFHISLDHVS